MPHGGVAYHCYVVYVQWGDAVLLRKFFYHVVYAADDAALQLGKSCFAHCAVLYAGDDIPAVQALGIGAGGCAEVLICV